MCRIKDKCRSLLISALGDMCIDGRCRLREYVENGPHPPFGKTGAKFIIRDDGNRLDLRYLKPSQRHLELGYKVWCHFLTLCSILCLTHAGKTGELGLPAHPPCSVAFHSKKGKGCAF